MFKSSDATASMLKKLKRKPADGEQGDSKLTKKANIAPNTNLQCLSAHDNRYSFYVMVIRAGIYTPQTLPVIFFDQLSQIAEKAQAMSKKDYLITDEEKNVIITLLKNLNPEEKKLIFNPHALFEICRGNTILINLICTQLQIPVSQESAVIKIERYEGMLDKDMEVTKLTKHEEEEIRTMWLFIKEELVLWQMVCERARNWQLFTYEEIMELYSAIAHTVHEEINTIALLPPPVVSIVVDYTVAPICRYGF